MGESRMPPEYWRAQYDLLTGADPEVVEQVGEPRVCAVGSILRCPGIICWHRSYIVNRTSCLSKGV